MSSSLKRPVQRKHKPGKQYSHHNYRSALTLLLEDFEDRCAYSMVHVKMISESEMHVDHFDPRLKAKCGYENLYPAYGLCNEAKSNTWPTDEDISAGVHLLDPCKDNDYGHVIFEDPATHELIGTTAAAEYHIIVLDLNNPAIVAQRYERSEWRRLLDQPVLKRPSAEVPDTELREICGNLLAILRHKIPEIPPPPPEARAGS